ncbi:MAG TPA: carbohydrate binding family 9 domain-containing protein [Gemmatimonadales bacterium]|nr:carbohydrate binding family 9 domain-containing protein [Gemmatimonadales bacterium]
MGPILTSAGLVLAGLSAPQGHDSAGRDTIRAVAVPIGDRPSWDAADSIDDLRQREPRQGEPASERTVVRVARDGSTLFVWVRCFDSDMRRIRATQLRRDADLSSDDHVELLIDSFNDHRSAFVFGTNPNGAMWDAQFSGVDDLNASWNGVWDVTVARDTLGWTAQFTIPFLALRFRPGANPAFGFNVRRFIRRKNEEDLWRSYGRAQGLYLLNKEGTITGLSGLRRPHDLELYPYVLGRVVQAEHDSLGGRTAGGYLGGKSGIDAKLPLSPTLTADLTAGTDFAQIEADQ